VLGALSIWCLLSGYALSYCIELRVEHGTQVDILLAIMLSSVVSLINVFALLVSIYAFIESLKDTYYGK
jgi:hypothetical protein